MTPSRDSPDPFIERVRAAAGFLAVVALLGLIIYNAVAAPLMWESAERDITVLIALIAALLGVDLAVTNARPIAAALAGALAESLAEKATDTDDRDQDRDRDGGGN